jgi:hypothetical protein
MVASRRVSVRDGGRQGPTTSQGYIAGLPWVQTLAEGMTTPYHHGRYDDNAHADTLP